jgi:hypothetical protein
MSVAAWARAEHRLDPLLVTQEVARVRPSATSEGWVRVNCPYCLDRVGKADRRASIGFNVKSGYFRCFRCKAKGRARGFEDIAQGDKWAPPLAPQEREVCLPPQGFVALRDEPGRSAAATTPAWDYLAARGVSVQAIEEADIGFIVGQYPGSIWAHRVVVPICDPDAGSWVGWVARALRKVEPKYLNASGPWASHYLFNGAALHEETAEPALIVEGVFDALPYWPQACALLGKPSHAQVAVLAGALRPLAICLDGDARDESWALAMRLRLEGARVGVVVLPPGTDPNEGVDPEWLRVRAVECLDEPL